MSKDSIDQMFENMFGYKDPKPETKTAPTPPIDGKGTVEDAARAVQEALKAHTGRRRPVDTWKPVAAKVMGLKRLVKKRWDAVLVRGVELGLFRLDTEALSFAILVPLDPKPLALIAANDTEEVVTGMGNTALRPDDDDDVPPPKGMPKDWKAPARLDCGHQDIGGPHDEAREEGHCCVQGKKQMPSDIRSQKGKYRTPLRMSQRRTAERANTMGFPGLCCDAEGYYIGGVANDCRMGRKKNKKDWCPFHQDEHKSKAAARRRVKGKSAP